MALLQFDAYVSVDDVNNYDKKCFEIDYDPTLKDLNEFAKDQGFKDIMNLFESVITDEDDEYLLELVKEHYNSQHYNRLEWELADVNYDKEFQHFLENKYRHQFIQQLPFKLGLIADNFVFDDED